MDLIALISSLGKRLTGWEVWYSISDSSPKTHLVEVENKLKRFQELQ